MTNARLDPDRVRQILADAEVDGVHVRLITKLDRKDYLAVAKVLEALGGEWSRRDRAHVFASDPAAAIARFVHGGAAPRHPRVAEGYVATPDAVGDLIVSKHSNVPNLCDGAAVLEPSAGDGALVRAIHRHRGASLHVIAIEPNSERARQITGAHTVLVDTLERFSSQRPRRRFDSVVMNPPFALPGAPTTWIDHVRMAWSLLAPGGRLVSVAPAGLEFRRDRRHNAIRSLVDECGGWHELPNDAFAESGTAVRTVVLWLDRQADAR